MSNLISETQKREIEALAVEHSGALIGYGADLYNRGYKRGFIEGPISIFVGIGICALVDKVIVPKIKEHINNKITTE